MQIPDSDPLSPMSSRFPLSPPRGLVEPSAEAPSGRSTRPFGMGFAVVPPMRAAGKNSKKPTKEVKHFQTAIHDDGQISRYEPDEEITLQMDEE